MRRYYLTKAAQSGPRPGQLGTRADVLASAAGGNCHNLIPVGAVVGDWCLAVVDCRDHTTLVADPDCRDFPDMTLDAQLNTISATLRNRLLTALQGAGVDTTGITNTTAFRIVVRRAGQRFSAGFSEDAFDVKPAL